MKKYLKIGFDGYLSKPIDTEELSKTLTDSIAPSYKKAATIELPSLPAYAKVNSITVTSPAADATAKVEEGKIVVTPTPTATTNGQAAGAALKSLYTQYKADGKLDMANLTNIMNLATLANNVKDLKGQTNKSAFYKDFATGLVAGSNNLVTSSNSNAVMSGLSKLVNNVDLTALQGKATDVVSNVTTKGTEALENANQIATSVTSILNLFK